VKVLILHQHFNVPEKGGPLRSYYLAKALIAKGAWPVIITAHTEKKYRVEISEGMEVHYLPINYQNRFGFYKRIYAFIRFAFGAIAIARKFKQAKLCYAISVPLTVGLAAITIKKLYKIPFIFEVGDLWPEAPIRLGIVRNKKLQQFLYYLEHKIYREARSIVALSTPIGEDIKRRYPSMTVDVIPNMSDVNFFKPGKRDSMISGVPNDKFIVSYIGAIGYANGLDQLIECCRHSSQAGLPVHFVICGRGGMLETIRKAVDDAGLKNVTFLSFQNREGVRMLLEMTDAIFISYRHVAILETGSPNKFFDGLAAGKLIITNFGGWVKDEIENNECGFSVQPGQPQEFVKQLIPFLEDKLLLQKYQQNSRRLAEQKYNRATLADVLSDLIIR
jgi:glycosyltransferase involved in cell wall biosynthesis